MMKRKFALFLAAVMSIAALPQAAFAAISDNYLSKSGLNVPNYTLFYEQGWPGVSGGSVTGNDDKVEYWIDGSNLVIELNNTLENGITGTGIFKVQLENASWFFRAEESNSVSLPIQASETAGITSTIAESLKTSYPDYITESGGAYTAKSEVVTTDYTGTGYPTDSTGAKLKTTFNPSDGVYFNNNYLRLAPNQVQYMLRVSPIDSSVATVSILGNTGASATDGAKKRLVIPLVVRTGGDDTEVTVSITDSATSISTNRFLLAQGSEGRTRTTATGTVTARTDFDLKEIVINELRIGSIKQGASFELVAPSGYYFDNINNAQVFTESGLRWASGQSGLGTSTGDTPDYTINYRNRNTRQDRNIVEVTLPGVRPSTNIRGALYIKGLMLVSEEVDDVISDQELYIAIRDTGNDSITDESFLVGRVADYTVSLTRVRDTIPELISGRLERYTLIQNGVYSSDGTVSDDDHRAATVRVEERIPNAWWSERTTEFTLPEGVKILKARFTNVENLSDASRTSLTTVGTSNDNDFYNTGSRQNSVVTLKDNRLTISRLSVKDASKRARFDLTLWLNIRVDFEGDIDLTLTGSAVTGAEGGSSVTIARAIKPVTVTTKVSDVKVGYQYLSVGDFDITETKAGNLEQGKAVYISVTDEISFDMSIAKGFTAQVVEGNLRISNILTQSALGYTGETIEGQVKFDIDRASTQASTIRFSNVQVKVDRSVPYSNLSNENDRGINLVVWGPAIAGNYEGLIGDIKKGLPADTSINTRDFFTVPGIREKYINVTTAATGENNQFSNVVKVTIGNPVILIGQDQYTMPVSAYVSTRSNSTMVPVRFISNALGLADEKVKWDDASKTVTVDAGTRIVQFQIGNTNYLANGVSIPMTSPDGLPVAAEITNERSFVPFRALGDAFNITVAWDAATSTATYNAPIPQ
ncbi:copper amine oxidase N-terminal domain-containing protein [Anaeropeptidivorans aminofermentans]|uniref:copper amine oxidase N-terminal domain-containing protein n=1 Tax=Anaeropeptidivorans aminofermentans TaxID=2934315 RepID=UPI0020242AAE|nr:copper amine oxidase N-terminal domain-containing protein [Anaeropeptidivorans aminofermentans]